MATITVSNSAELTAALSQASGGDTILLAAGDYGRLEITGSYNSPLTIASANPGDPASFSTMSISGAENVTIDSVLFDYSYKYSDIPMARPFSVMNSSNITIQNSVFEGDIMSGTGSTLSGYGTGVGLSVQRSSGVDITNNEFKNWGNGLLVNESQDVEIQGNNIHDVRRDGMTFSEVQGVLIEGNYIHDFKGLPDWSDHRDMIQFWTTGTDKPSTDIIIRNNVLDIGGGSFTQSIFMRNERVDTGQDGREMYYQNVLIENNTIINHHTHGITVGETDGLVIRNNTLTAAVPDPTEASTQGLLNKFGAGSGIFVPQINVSDDADEVSINNNTFYGADGFTQDRVSEYGGSGWSVTGNISYPNNLGPEPGSVGDDGGVGSGGSTDGGGSNGGGTVVSLPVLDDYVTNFASLVGTSALKGNAFVQNGVLKLDGIGDYVNLGPLSEVSKSDDLSLSMTFSKDVADGGTDILAWNINKMGVILKGDGIVVKVAGDDGKFQKFSSGNLGLNDTDKHTVTVIVDSDTDRLQVIVDGEIAIDRFDIDLDLVHARSYDWYMGGAKWGNGFDGTITAFHLEADANFFIDDAHNDAALFE